jgi:hypothetical protein
MVTDRYLTDRAKAEVLAEWERLKANPRPLGAPGGRGLPDPEIIPYVDALNALEGVCTLQSCCGHTDDRSRGVDAPGHLWLWLSEAMSREFDRRAFVLAGKPYVECVERMYSEWGQEIASITFAGAERDLLPESGQSIIRFFHSLATSCRSLLPSASTGTHCTVRQSSASCTESRSSTSANSSSSCTSAKRHDPSSCDTP